MLTHGSLFSGIGGFDLAARWAGWQNVWSCEIDPFCQKVLHKNFPETHNYGNIITTDWTKAKSVDIISGGFPCQPFSTAGKRKGAEDDRYLWPAMLKVIQTVRPTWVVGENVAGIINMGLTTVLAEMEDIGYSVQTFLIPAAAVGAPHTRNRIWIVASNNNQKQCPQSLEQRSNQESRSEWARDKTNLYVTDSWNARERNDRVYGDIDGLSKRLDRIGALGNAIVPQIAFEIFKAISLTYQQD
jgi:DNA (cytosine-5)-methyltransferase 1